MTFVGLAVFGMVLMGACCWASNIWPGHKTWWRAILSRVLWWAAPIGTIVYINGAPWDNALTLAVAAWCGAWVPHVRFPDDDSEWQTVLSQAAIKLLRVTALLLPIGAIFYLCGAYWLAMVFCVSSSAGCMYLAAKLPGGPIGLGDSWEVNGVLFGSSVGFWLAVAVWTPTMAPDFLP